MAMGKTLAGEIIAWGTLAMVVVIISIVLLNFKGISGVTAELNTSIDTYVTAFQEPANWVIIVIIALIGITLITYFVKKFKGTGNM